MIKVLYLITDLDVGGAERALAKLATRLDRSRFQVSVACLTGRGELGKAIARDGVPVTYLDMRGKLDLSVVFRLRRLLDATACDILHTFLFHANVLGRLATLLSFEKPLVVASVRVAERRRWHLWLESWTSGLADRFLAVSEGVRTHMIERAGIPPHKISTLPNGVDASDIPKRRVNIRAELSLPEDCPIVATVGRLTRQKGHRYLISAAARIVSSRPDVHFLIIGAGPLERALRRRAARLKIAANVHFLGWREDAWRIVAGADLFVLPSLWEGMPNALLEAMAAGVPVVATRVSGVSEIVANDKTGVLVPAEDDRVLAHAVYGLLMNPDRARLLAQAGREKTLRDFSIEATVSAHENLYAELVQKRQIARLPDEE